MKLAMGKVKENLVWGSSWGIHKIHKTKKKGIWKYFKLSKDDHYANQLHYGKVFGNVFEEEQVFFNRLGLWDETKIRWTSIQFFREWIMSSHSYFLHSLLKKKFKKSNPQSPIPCWWCVTSLSFKMIDWANNFVFNNDHNFGKCRNNFTCTCMNFPLILNGHIEKEKERKRERERILILFLFYFQKEKRRK